MAQLALWLFVIGGGLLYVSFVYTPPESGVTAWPPLSDTVFISNNGPDVWITAVGLTVLGVVLQAINLAVTISKLRAPGLAWRRLPSGELVAERQLPKGLVAAAAFSPDAGALPLVPPPEPIPPPSPETGPSLLQDVTQLPRR